MDIYCLAVAAAADEWIEGWLVAGVAMREYNAAFERLARRQEEECVTWE